jgi:hypothetical protein
MQRKDRVRRLLFRLLLLSALSWLVRVICRSRDVDSWEYPGSTRWEPTEPVIKSETLETERPKKAARVTRRPLSARRVATSFAFAVLFFAGAAFTAGAGDQVARFVEGDQACAIAEAYDASAAEEPADEASACEDAAEDSSTEAAAAPALDSLVTAREASSAPASEAPQAAETQDTANASSANAWAKKAESAAKPAAKRTSMERRLNPAERPIRARGTHRWVVKRARAVPNAPEIEDPDAAATIWLNRALPDPTPPARRLTPRFAKNLAKVAKAERVDWALLLAVLRVQGDRSAVPATKNELHVLAQRLRTEHVNRDAWAAALALSGRTGFADRTMALMHYNRAVGLRALVTGLKAAKPRLVKALLADKRVSIYAGGREDLRRDRIDVRVVVLMRYLTETFDQVTISSLFSGHRKYSRPGVISAHTYGHAVDIAGLGGSTIFGHQQPGGLTETAVRAILLLPSEVQPRQVISLLGLGGASFPLADHADHIHVGY